MRPDTVLTLGDFEFQATEVPEKISFGGSQAVVVHQLPGGGRVVDAMGGSDMPLEWSGRFRSDDALDRARELDAMREEGAVLSLSWSELAYDVVIRDFKADFERFYEIPYTISCEVVENQTAPAGLPEISVDDALASDMEDALGLGDDIADDGLSGFLELASNKLGKITDLLNAGLGRINQVLAPLADAADAVAVLILDAETVIDAVDVIGGVAAGDYNQGAALIEQTAAADRVCKLYELNSLLGRMTVNLQNSHTTGGKIQVAGALLQKIAAEEYGDPNEWTTIARANGLVDPVVGLADLTIPPRPSKKDGVLIRA